ncbi:MAG: M23 family metallopeptidase [Sterolibacterium sp.]
MRPAITGPFRVVLGAAGIALFGMVAAFGSAPSSFDMQVPQQTVIEQLAVPADLGVTKEGTDIFVNEVTIQRGDSVAALFSRLGIQDDEVFRFLRGNRSAQAIFQQLRPGKQVTAHVGANGELHALIYPLNNKDRALFVERRDGRLQVSEQALQLDTQVQMKSGEISYSLFGATDTAGLPDSVAIRLTDIFGGDIDFHHDLRRGDRFAVIYEIQTNRGHPIRMGRVLAAEFVNQGKTYRAIWFEDAEGKGGYYNADGKSLRKAFLRSPLEFSRITSGYSSARLHPILHQWRAHKGVDLGAPIGTRVKATADGVVDFVGNQGGYGRVVILRHQGRYSTLYGHLSSFAAGIKKGERVVQGEVVGCVGTSGWSTGPHLHYEFRVDGVYQNPLAFSQISTPPLEPKQLGQFRASAQPQLAHLDLIKGRNLALLD